MTENERVESFIEKIKYGPISYFEDTIKTIDEHIEECKQPVNLENANAQKMDQSKRKLRDDIETEQKTLDNIKQAYEIAKKAFYYEQQITDICIKEFTEMFKDKQQLRTNLVSEYVTACFDLEISNLFSALDAPLYRTSSEKWKSKIKEKIEEHKTNPIKMKEYSLPSLPTSILKIGKNL